MRFAGKNLKRNMEKWNLGITVLLVCLLSSCMNRPGGLSKENCQYDRLLALPPRFLSWLTCRSDFRRPFNTFLRFPVPRW